jgi:nucleoside-diphosphate-sugar epimerase
MKKVILTGSQGFIGSYICDELLRNGYVVYGIDNYSKYGKVARPHDNHPNFHFWEEDVNNWDLKKGIPHKEWKDAEHLIACAAMIGGITYFHKYAYDLVAHNERVMANTYDLAIHHLPKLKKVTVLSSSMVYENTDIYPTPESQIYSCPPPSSTYGFQKLSAEYFARGAWEQYKTPYTIIRPFNCVGVGEEEAIGEEEVMSGNVKLMMSHVVPDLINKTLKGQEPLHILGEGNQVRCYTNGRDIARGIRMSLDHPNALNQDFNISTPVATSVLELAEDIWKKLKPNKEFKFTSDEPMTYDVQKRVPDTEKAKRLLGFEAEISLGDSLDEVIKYLKNKC